MHGGRRLAARSGARVFQTETTHGQGLASEVGVFWVQCPNTGITAHCIDGTLKGLRLVWKGSELKVTLSVRTTGI